MAVGLRDRTAALDHDAQHDIAVTHGIRRVGRGLRHGRIAVTRSLRPHVMQYDARGNIHLAVEAVEEILLHREPRIGIEPYTACHRDIAITHTHRGIRKLGHRTHGTVGHATLRGVVARQHDMAVGDGSHGASAQRRCHLVAIHTLAIVVVIVVAAVPLVYHEARRRLDPYVHTLRPRIGECRAVDAVCDKVVLPRIVVGTLRNITPVCLRLVRLALARLYTVRRARRRSYRRLKEQRHGLARTVEYNLRRYLLALRGRHHDIVCRNTGTPQIAPCNLDSLAAALQICFIRHFGHQAAARAARRQGTRGKKTYHSSHLHSLYQLSKLPRPASHGCLPM